MQEALPAIFKSKTNAPLTFCPRCEEIFGALAGSKEALCKNCGYKEPCCE